MTKIENADRRIAELEKELTATQEMLAFVLQSVGEEVLVTKEQIANGLPEGTQIQVDDDLARDAFVFGLAVVE